MHASKLSVVHLASSLCVLAAGSLVFAQLYPPELLYGPRGNRSEGLAAEPKSADAIVLISALADVNSRDALAEWPAELHLRFYLPRDAGQPSIRVRQLRSLTGYYKLDNVTPTRPWAAGGVNDFSWTKNVLARVYDYQVPATRRTEITKSDWLSDLGVVVTLGSTAPGNLQNLTVAPSALDQSNRPFAVSSYWFTLRTNAPATVTGAIFSAANKEVFSGLKYEATPGSPFTIKWLPKGQAEGWYRLMLDASLAGKPQLLVRFYHKAI